MTIKKLAKKFDKFSVAVTGSKGSGKDVLFGNVIQARKTAYIANLDYTKDKRFIPLNLEDFNVKNDYRNFISGQFNRYVYPYPDGLDIYISDAGVYFPSQFNGELNRDYKHFPTYFALSRQISDTAIHYNCQAYGRVWDKIREQCDWYLRCNWCKFIGGLVIMSITEFDKAESCQNRVKPQKLTRVGLLSNKREKLNESIARDQFQNTYGYVRNRLLIFWNKSKHDTRRFREVLENGKE